MPRTTVPSLFGARCPVTVARRVRPIVVDTLDGQLRVRPLAHVGDERFEGIAPACTNGDAPRAVFRPVLASRVGASLEDRYPHSVNTAPALSVGAVSTEGVSLALQTTAGRSRAATDMPSLRDALPAAVALASPHNQAATVRRLSDDGQTPEALAGEVDQSHGAIVRELTLPMALELAANLSALDRADVLRMHQDLEEWAQSRCALPGTAWALIVDDKVIAAGGVVSKDAETGVLWLAGREGWAMPYVIHAVRIWRAVMASGLYRRFECECAVGREAAMQFAERMGLQQMFVKDGFVHYGVQL